VRGELRPVAFRVAALGVRVARTIGVIGFSCVVGFGCAASGNYAPETYVVRPHDTLYSIAWRHDLDYRDLARWNKIGSDYRIAVGQVLTLKPSARAASRPPATPPSAPPKAPPTAGASAGPPTGSTHSHELPQVGAPQPLRNPPAVGGSAGTGAGAETLSQAPAGATAANKPMAVPGGAMQWVWPTAHASAPRPVPGGGILLLGQLGQPIRAACSGRVVYVGNGIRGYGNLIIIKHGDNLLSAYAHTRELNVREGQDVQGAQVIAEMGTGPHQIAALYFEIRLNGKPVDPMPYLSGAGAK
jgi:lipoprotein NlpD